MVPGDDSPAEPADILIYGLSGGRAGSVPSFLPFATVLGGYLGHSLRGEL